MDRTELDKKEARQGETSGRMRKVLFASIAGAVVVLGALFLISG